MLNYKEDLLVFFLHSKIRLSGYDYRFITNLLLLIDKGKKLTSNQSALFDKLLSKYKTQLSKKGLTTHDIVNLNWKVEVQESSIEFTGAKIYLDNGYICVRVPFSKKFISALKNQNYFVWNNPNKIYQAHFSTKALKYALEIVPNFFEHVECCNNVKHILDGLPEKNLVWNPTLKESKGYYYIANINETLYKLLKDVELNDNPYVLYQLSKMGIEIDDNIVKANPFKRFSSQFICHVDIDELKNVSSYLQELNINTVFATRSFIRLVHSIRHDIITALNNISIHPVSEIGDKKNFIVINYGVSNFDVDLNSYSKKIDKIILITNSRLINVK